MSYFDRRPQVFRIVFGIGVACALSFAGFTVYRFGKSPSDENIFQDPPSNAYVTKAIYARLLDNTADHPVLDSIRVGDLILSVNSKRFPSFEEGLKYFTALSKTDSVVFEIDRPVDGNRYRYGFRKGETSTANVRKMQPAALVVDVTPGGASDRAGMNVGDLIMRINGERFNNVLEADAILQRGETGKTIDYEILRNNEIITLHVTLASFGFQIAFLSLILCGLCYIATGVALAEARPQFAATRLVGLFFFLVGYLLVLGIATRGLDSAWTKAARIWLLTGSLCFAFPVLLHSRHYFPKDRPDLLKRRWVLPAAYLSALVGLVIIRTLSLEILPMVTVIVLAVFVFLIPFVLRKECPADYKKMNRLVRWTSFVIAVASVAFAVVVPRQTNIHALKLAGVYGVVLLLLPAAYVYTIGRYRLFDLVLRVRRSVQYTFVSILWTVLLISVLLSTISWLVQEDFKLPYIRVTSSSIEFTDTPTSPLEQATAQRGVLVVLVLATTLVLLRIHRSGGRFISEKFYRARYDYRRAANELAEAMSTTLSMTHLAKEIVAKLGTLMRIKRVGLLFFRAEGVCCCHEAYGFDGTSWDEFCMNIDSQLIHGLRQLTHEVSVESLPPALKDVFRKEEFRYVIPVRSKDRLVGTMLIGEKMSESSFTPEDLEFLGAVAKQASVAIENAFLYEEQAEQERMKHELEIARRIQLESLPQSTPDIKGLDIAGISIPAFEVGGDYFDYLNGNPTELTVIVGDVSGKGTSAALYMSKMQGILRSLHGFGLSPRELFIRANHLLRGDIEKRSFITAIGAAFDTKRKRLALARAGHLPLFRFNARTKKVEKVTPKGLGLGLSAERIFARELEECGIRYGEGDVFVFVTDGITEGRRSAGDEFGEERLLKILSETSDRSAATIRDKVIDEVKKFSGEAGQLDDQTVVVVKAHGAKNRKAGTRKKSRA